MTLTTDAAEQIRSLVAQPDAPEGSGVRIASSDEGALTLTLTATPADGDTVVEDGGARVFLEPNAGALLNDKALDAATDPQGQVQFTLAEQA